MRKITRITEVFRFNELDQDAMDKAINDTVEFLLETYDENTASKELVEAIHKADEMGAPWYVLEYAGKEVRELCDEWEYLIDGTMFVD